MKLNLLYVGDLWTGSTALQRLDALKTLNYNIVEIDSTQVLNKIQQLLFRISFKLKWPIDFIGLNKKIIDTINQQAFDVMWVDKGLFIKPGTLKLAKQKGIKLVNYSPDDMINKNNQSNYYLAAMPVYDVHVSTKSYNMEELKQLGAKKVIFSDKGFDPTLHHPVQPTESELRELGSLVGFIGSYEDDRAESIKYLCKNGIEVRVYGSTWAHLKNKIPNLIVDSNSYFHRSYVTVLNCIEINLCFLKKQNRDLQTQRSVEITACGRFMIGERTAEHLRLFKENEEAVYFDNDNKEELLEKVRYYLDKKELRDKIGQAARARCIESKYDINSRLEQVIHSIN
ncbi:MAG: glycosyltransferase [Bacteroidota bacterium]